MAGVISRGITAPIIREGDDIVKIAVESVLAQAAREGFTVQDRDVVCVTESVVARADRNYCTVDDIASDVRAKCPGGTVGAVFPILSRNRFAIVLRGIARGARKVVLQLSYPADEVGNHLVDVDALDKSGVNPWTDVLSVPDFRKHFGTPLHPFTQMDYIAYYADLIREEGAEAEIILANHAEDILSYTHEVICCDIHTRERTRRLLCEAAPAARVYTLCDLLASSINGSGYNPDYGLLGSNKATEQTVKLFPKNAQAVADGVQALMLSKTGKHVEAMVYGDGAFKDPVGKIWELADPVVSPGFTAGLVGLPNEIKLKYLADNDFADLSGEALAAAIRERIREKGDLMGQMAAQGTTPRRLTDLLGSLCDLTSGSGDRGTPVILIQNYFTNYASA